MSLAALLAASAVILLAALALEPAARRIDVAVPLVFLGVGLALGLLSGTARHEVDAGQLETPGTIALVLILVDGGLRTGIRALRRELVPVLVLGTGGTLVTFALVTFATHWVTGLGWTLSLIVGAALSPTDPAAVFSVLHGRSGGSLRVATVLEGEAGFNDPVSIALVIALIDAAHGGHDPAVGEIAWTMLREGVVGVVVGVGLALLLERLLSSRRPNIRRRARARRLARCVPGLRRRRRRARLGLPRRLPLRSDARRSPGGRPRGRRPPAGSALEPRGGRHVRAARRRADDDPAARIAGGRARHRRGCSCS